MDEQDYSTAIDLITIDVPRRKKVQVKLIDANGDEVPFRDTIKQLSSYLNDKIAQGTESKNHVLSQVLPLMHQSITVALPNLVGPEMASTMLALDRVRTPITFLMLLSFSILKLIQQKDFKIVTTETDISEEELEKMQRLHQATSAAMLASLTGINPREILRELVKRGEITEEELLELTGELKNKVEN